MWCSYLAIVLAMGILLRIQFTYGLQSKPYSTLRNINQFKYEGKVRPGFRIHAGFNKDAVKKENHIINEQIPYSVVRLLVPKEDEGHVGEDEMVGVVSIDLALEEARSRELDLVVINEKSDPPICKVINYGKFKYMIEKRKKENMKKQIKVETKEVKMSVSIEQHDFDVRVRATQKFLADGDRVKVIVQFKGREMQHTGIGRELLMQLFQAISGMAVMDGEPKMEGRSMSVLLSPKKQKNNK